MENNDPIKQSIFVSRPLRIGASPTSGYIYSKELLEGFVTKWKASETPMFATLAKRKENAKDYLYLDLTSVASKISDMYVDDEGLVVEHEILDTPNGKILKDLMIEATQNSPLLTFQVTPVLNGKLNGNEVVDATLRYFEFSGMPLSDNE